MRCLDYARHDKKALEMARGRGGLRPQHKSKETSRSPHLIKKGLYRLFEKQGRLCPVVLVLHVAELDGLAGDLNLLEVTQLVLPLLLEVDAVAVGELD